METEEIRTKRCSQCREEKPINDFNKHIRKKDGYDAMCIDCKRKLKGKFKGQGNCWGNITFEDCKYYSDKCKTRVEFHRDHLAHYSMAKKNNWLDKLIPIEIITSKVCSKCKKEKPIYKFHNTKGNKVTGKMSICMDCAKIMSEKQLKEHTRIPYDKCKVKAEKCKSRKEFALKYSKYYTSSRLNKWLDDFFPATKYERKRVIYSYVFPDNSVYIGLTCQPKQRHHQHMTTENSTVFQYMNRTLQIPEWNILTDFVDQNESKKLEGYYLNRYKKRGYSILNKAKTGCIGGGILTVTIDKSIEFAKQCKTRTEMCKKHRRYYDLLLSEGLIDKYFKRYVRDSYVTDNETV